MRVCLHVLCGHLLGKGWPLGSRLWCLTVSLSLSHWYLGSGVVLDCIDSWSLHPYLIWSGFKLFSNLQVHSWNNFWRKKTTTEDDKIHAKLPSMQRVNVSGTYNIGSAKNSLISSQEKVLDAECCIDGSLVSLAEVSQVTIVAGWAELVKRTDKLQSLKTGTSLSHYSDHICRPIKLLKNIQ